MTTDGIDARLETYIEGLVAAVLANPRFAQIDSAKKSQLEEQVRERFSEVILDTLLARLTDEQLIEIDKVKGEMGELEKKIKEYAASFPDLADEFNLKLQIEAEALKQHLPL